MVDSTLKLIHCSSVKHSVVKVIPHLNLGWQEMACELGHSTPIYFKLQGMICATAWVYQTLVEADGSLLNKQWFEFELTTKYIAQQHDIDDTTRNYDQRKAWPLNKPGARDAEGDIQQLTPSLENNTLLKD